MKTNTHRPAIFLDRDGTIIEDKGNLSNINDVDIFPFSIEALKILQTKYQLFIVTNQSAVGLGRITLSQAQEINRHVVDTLLSHGVTIQEVYCCAHTRNDNCDCIKPKPYFIKKAQEKYSLDIPNSFSIGDHPHDVQFAQNAGGRGLYVLTGHGQKHFNDLDPQSLTFNNLLEAAQWITSISTPH